MKWERIAQGKGLPGSAENSSALFLEPSPKLWKVLQGIFPDGSTPYRDMFCEGCLILLANGKHGGKRLCLLTADWNLVYQSQEEVICVTPGSIDEKAIEDGRLMLVEDTFFLWYCGYNGIEGRACMAYSQDLLHWKKEAPLQGGINESQNKDHVIFPDKINGNYYIFHRPWGEKLFPRDYNMPIRSGKSKSLYGGVWEDLGILLAPEESSQHQHDWLGAGAAPIPIGENRYLELYHNAWFEKNGWRQYHLSAAILDFSQGDPGIPQSLVTHRMESVLEPDPGFPNEINEELRISIVFPMSCWVKDDWLYVVYGAGDKTTCAARVGFSDLLEELEKHPVKKEIEKR